MNLEVNNLTFEWKVGKTKKKKKILQDTAYTKKIHATYHCRKKN